jgi:hypothetical protein
MRVEESKTTQAAHLRRALALGVVTLIAVRVVQASDFTVLARLSTSAVTPESGVTRDAEGNLYGTTLFGIGYYGTVFKLDTVGDHPRPGGEPLRHHLFQLLFNVLSQDWSRLQTGRRGEIHRTT